MNEIKIKIETDSEQAIEDMDKLIERLEKIIKLKKELKYLEQPEIKTYYHYPPQTTTITY